MAAPLTHKTYGELRFLPHNYMPAGLAALRGEKDAFSRPVLPMLIDDRRVRYAIFDAITISKPEDLSQQVQVLFNEMDLSGIPMLGHKFRLDITTSRSVSENLPDLDDGEAGRAVVVIDVGIAFWNERFCPTPAASRFRDIVYLDLFGPASGKALVARLESASRTAIMNFVGTSGGQKRAVAALKSSFPNSFFGDDPAIDGFWHGTAVADLAAGERDDTILFGVELPRIALTDYGGDTLQAVLPAALSAALRMTKHVGDKPTVIVLAFACPGGPHDGTHPVASLITNFLTTAKESGRNVQLVLPAGNHLQDRCCARLDGNGDTVTWTLANEDRSPNTVEICVEAGAWDEFALTAPDGSALVLSPAHLMPGHFAEIRLDDTVIGGIHNLPSGENAKLRLSLAPTAWKPGEPRPAPAGDWKIGVRASSAVNLWILRDDRDATGRIPSMFSHPDYRERRSDGSWIMDDTMTGNLRRLGTASVYTTTKAKGAVTVEAQQSDRAKSVTSTAPYSGQAFTQQNGGPKFPLTHRETVDIGEPFNGLEAVHNGTSVILERFSGTSAAAALAARKLP